MWLGAWRLSFGGWWLGLGGLGVPGGPRGSPDLREQGGSGGSGCGSWAGGGRTIGGGNGSLLTYISQPARPPAGGLADLLYALTNTHEHVQHISIRNITLNILLLNIRI